jgi:transposase
MTLEELRDALSQQGIQVGRSSVDRFLKARGVTLKKSRSTPQSRADRT